MARKIQEIRITEANRDQGKLFVITEMPATLAEVWATDLAFLIRREGSTLSERPAVDGTAGLAALQKQTDAVVFMRAMQDPSVAYWWDCIRYQHDPAQMPQKIMQGANCQIEEISTIRELRTAIIEMHLGFFSAENPSTSGSPSPTNRKG